VTNSQQTDGQTNWVHFVRPTPMLLLALQAADAARRLLTTSVHRDAKRTITHLVTGRRVPGDESDCQRATNAVPPSDNYWNRGLWLLFGIRRLPDWWPQIEFYQAAPSPQCDDSSFVRLRGIWQEMEEHGDSARIAGWQLDQTLI